MNTPPLHPPSRDAAQPGTRPPCMVVDIGLSCPSCRVQLTLPSAFLGQVVTGPCPVCGCTLVFCHGRLESGAGPTGLGPVIDVSSADRTLSAPRTKLPRNGTPDVSYLDDIAFGDGGESSWGLAAGPDGAPGAAVSRPPADQRLQWVWGLGVVAVLVLAATVWQLSQPAPPLPAPQPATPGTGGNGPRAIPVGWAEDALAAWQAFARATTVEAKLAHVLDAERVAPSMRAFYAAHPSSDEVWASREFKPLAGTADDRRRGLIALGFSPTSSDERAIIIFLRSTPPAHDVTGPNAAAPPFLLDWETYIQERERLIEGFLNDTASPRRSFRLAIERVHVFSDAGPTPGQAEPLGLRLRTPSGLRLPQVAELSADSPLFARLDSQLHWGTPAYATLQLAWDTATGPVPRVVVSDFVCWHFPSLGGTPEFETDLSPLPSAPAPPR